MSEAVGQVSDLALGLPIALSVRCTTLRDMDTLIVERPIPGETRHALGVGATAAEA